MAELEKKMLEEAMKKIEDKSSSPSTEGEPAPSSEETAPTQKPEDAPTPKQPEDEEKTEGAEQDSGEGGAIKFPLTLKVDGEERVIENEEQLKALLQKELAGEKRLQEAAEREKQLREKELELKQKELELQQKLLLNREEVEQRAEEAGVELTDEDIDAIYSGDEEAFKRVVAKIARAENEELVKEIKELRKQVEELNQEKLKQQIVNTINELKEQTPVYKVLNEIEDELTERMIAAAMNVALLSGELEPGKPVSLDKMKEIANNYAGYFEKYVERRFPSVVEERAEEAFKIILEKKPQVLEDYKKQVIQEYLRRMKEEGESASIAFEGAGSSPPSGEENEWKEAATNTKVLKSIFQKIIGRGGEQ